MKPILVLLLAVLTVGALSACVTTPAPMPEAPYADPQDEQPTDAVDAVLAAAVTPNPHGSANRYPDELRQAFLNECVPQGGAQPCECVLQKMEQEYTVADIGAQRVSPDDIQRWTASCVGGGQPAAPVEPAYTPYPAEVRSAFLNECSPSGGQATCECVLQKMERSIPLERLANNDVPKDMLATWVQECLAN